jgi:hypothetical protein
MVKVNSNNNIRLVLDARHILYEHGLTAMCHSIEDLQASICWQQLRGQYRVG